MLQALQDGSVQWMQSKLMFVGEGRAGKTCTLRALLSKPFLDTESTVGLDLSACKIDRTNVTNWSEMHGFGNQCELAAARACATRMHREIKSSSIKHLGRVASENPENVNWFRFSRIALEVLLPRMHTYMHDPMYYGIQ